MTTGDPMGAFMIGPALLHAGAATGALHGLRLVVKDNIDVAGHPTGAGNPTWLAGAEPAATDAPVVADLVAAGASVTGKTVLDELAYSLSGTNVHYGTPRNPHAPGHLPGGSSSGSAVAVAAGLADVALGTDTGGSIRVPASYCGVVGLRTTHGLVSCAGVVPLAPSFDTVGLLTSDVASMQSVWSALVGGRSVDAARIARPVDLVPISRLVVPPELRDLAEPGERDLIDAAVAAVAARLDLTVDHRGLGGANGIESWATTFRTIQMGEAWAAHGGWITTHEPAFGPGIAARFTAASTVTAREIEQAERVRLRARAVLDQVCDGALLLQPTTPGPAPVMDLDPKAKDRLRSRDADPHRSSRAGRAPGAHGAPRSPRPGRLAPDQHLVRGRSGPRGRPLALAGDGVPPARRSSHRCLRGSPRCATRASPVVTTSSTCSSSGA